MFLSVGIGGRINLSLLDPQKLSVDEIGLSYVSGNLAEEFGVPVMAFTVDSGKVGGLLAMLGNSLVRGFVSSIVAFEVSLGGNASINVFLGGVTFHPSDADGLGRFGSGDFEEVFPEVSI